MKVYVLDGAGTHGRQDNSLIAGGVDRLEGTLIRKHDPDTTAEWVPWEARISIRTAPGSATNTHRGPNPQHW